MYLQLIHFNKEVRLTNDVYQANLDAKIYLTVLVRQLNNTRYNTLFHTSIRSRKMIITKQST